MNLLKKLKSLFQKSEGAHFKDPVKPGLEKVKKNVGKEVFERTGQLREGQSKRIDKKPKKKLAEAKDSKKSKSVKQRKNRTPVKQKVNVLKKTRTKLDEVKGKETVAKNKPSRKSNPGRDK